MHVYFTGQILTRKKEMNKVFESLQLSLNGILISSLLRYYAIATPSATQRLLLGLLEAPPSWAPDALDAAVQLVELLRAAEDYASGIRVSFSGGDVIFLDMI